MRKLLLLLLCCLSLSGVAQVDSLQIAIDIAQRYHDRASGITKAIEPAAAPVTPTLFSAFNVSVEADHLVNTNQIANDSISVLRAFNLDEKGLPKNGVIADGGTHPYGFEFQVIPNRQGRGSWDGNFFQNYMRFRAMKNQVDILIGVHENIVRYDSKGDDIVYAPFLYKNWQLWQYGKSPAEQSAKIHQHFLTWLLSMVMEDENGDDIEIFDYIEIANEPWGMTGREYQILKAARVEAWLEYNRMKGRYPKWDNGELVISHLLPKLGTCAVPLGQGYTPTAGSMRPIDMVMPKYDKYITYVNGHVYNIDSNGWSDDFSITQSQFDKLEQFRAAYYPNAKLFITEIGSNVDGDQAAYVEKVVTALSKNPNVMGIGWYSLRPIANSRFGRTYYQDYNGNDTKGMEAIKKLTFWKTRKNRA